MAAEDNPSARTTIATVVATAAVTLAIGVTVAALGGYLVPASDRNKTKPAQSTEPMVVETRPAAQPSAPNVVLVPVAPDSRVESSATGPTRPAPETHLAAYEPTQRGEHDSDHRRGRKHREREHEDDHDDDD